LLSRTSEVEGDAQRPLIERVEEQLRPFADDGAPFRVEAKRIERRDGLDEHGDIHDRRRPGIEDAEDG
jgi:hypothetical protein